jgi:hypothetical protein
MEQAKDLSESLGTGVQDWKEQVVDLPECERTEFQKQERIYLNDKEHGSYCLGLEGTGV